MQADAITPCVKAERNMLTVRVSGITWVTDCKTVFLNVKLILYPCYDMNMNLLSLTTLIITSQPLCLQYLHGQVTCLK